MSKKYLKSQSWTSVSTSLLDSGTWKFLVESKTRALQFMHKDINTGTWNWTGHNSGVFTFQNCWDIVRNKFIDWPFYSLAWFPNHSPKMTMCLIRVLHGKLLTRHFLKNIGIITEDHCLLCMTAAESIDHLFFHCPYSAYIWQLCKLKLGLLIPMENLHEEALSVILHFRQKSITSSLAKLVFSAAIWHIWRERNSRVFQHTSKHKIQVFKELYEDVNILLLPRSKKETFHGNMSSILRNWGISCSIASWFLYSIPQSLSTH